MLKLNIGCGNDTKDGYTNIDKYNKNADIIAPANDLPYDDNSVDEIYSSHLIEHLLPGTEDITTLNEWRRVLKPGGRLIIRCPNFERYINDWLGGNDEYREGWGLINIFGWKDRGVGMWHHTGFTVESLPKLLIKCGFVVTKCETIQTRQRRGPEYRPDGDIICECTKAK